MNKKLYRRKSGSMIGGVCSGLGEYLGIDPTLVRLAFVLLCLGGGSGILIYLVMWLVVPCREAEGVGSGGSASGCSTSAGSASGDSASTGPASSPAPCCGGSRAAVTVIGGVLIALGALMLLRNFALPWFWWLRLGTLWPLVLIGVGVLLVWNRVA